MPEMRRLLCHRMPALNNISRLPWIKGNVWKREHAGTPPEPSFSPDDLFAAGEQGAWYDPSDLSTLFQDSAGMAPVTADGQPVGLMLDKSQGLVLGPELVVSGGFDSATGWTLGAGFTISGSALNINASSGNAQNSFLGMAGIGYELTVDIASISGGSISVNIANSGHQISTPGVKTFKCVGPANNFLFILVSTGSPIAVVNSVSVKEIAGNHASQANAAACPLYKTSGGLHWLQFDGVDDFLRTAIFPIDGLSGDTFVGMLTPANNIAVWLTDQPGSGFWAVMQSGDTQSPTGVVCGTPGYRVDGVDLVAPTRTSLFAAATGGKSVVTTKGLVFGLETPTGLSISGYTGFLFSGNIYSIIVRGAIGTPQEITDTEMWINSKTGAY